MLIWTDWLLAGCDFYRSNALFFLPFFMNRRLSSGSVSLGRRSLGDEEAEDVSESRDGGPQRVQHGPSRRGRWGCALFHFPSWGLFLIWPANVTFTAHFNNPVPLLFAPSTASCEHQKHHFSALELFIAVQYKSVYYWIMLRKQQEG